ncbi:MAG TPA: hypothetical protein VG755_14500 [Nannocystaceae bacterium]|nr:hypothetical protein [Nannocystaceae bacterium]
MAAFPGAPRTARGAIAEVDPLSGITRVVTFQINPHTLTRSFEIPGGGGAGPESGQLSRPPIESIRVELEIDAADDLEAGLAPSVAARIAALEVLVTPSAASAIANAAIAAAGTIEIFPPSAPICLFCWGAGRVIPVVVKELQVTEEAHDPQLRPTRARATVGMRVLTWADVGPTHPAFAMSIAAQLSKEAQASKVTAASLDALTAATR